MFLRVRHVTVSADRDELLDLPLLTLEDSYDLIGLSGVGARKMYVIEVEDSLVWVVWTTIVFL